MKNRLSDQANQEVATTILQQFGARQFIAMTGAHNIVVLNTENYPYGGVQFDVKGSRKANRLMVTVDAMDTYTVQFWKIGRGYTGICEMVKEFTGVYDDMLRSIFTDVTGLETSLGTMGR